MRYASLALRRDMLRMGCNKGVHSEPGLRQDAQRVSKRRCATSLDFPKWKACSQAQNGQNAHKIYNKKNQCGHNFIFFQKNIPIIFLFYIFTALHQKFMYNCQVREKYLHVHFFQFHFDE